MARNPDRDAYKTAAAGEKISRIDERVMIPEPPREGRPNGLEVPEGIEGTREFPFFASNATAALFMLRRVRCSQIQRVAKIRHDQVFDWFNWALLLARERLWIPPGWYQHDDWDRPLCWRPITAEALLTVGASAPFNGVADVPRRAMMNVKKGVAAAHAAGHFAHGPETIARFLNITGDFRSEHRLWQIGAIDVDRSERRKKSKRMKSPSAIARRAEKKDADRRAKRLAAGAVPRAEYEASSLSRAKPWEVEGIDRATWYRRRKKT